MTSEDRLVSKTEKLRRLKIKGGNAEHGVEYTPSSYLALRLALKLFKEDHSNWSFIDIGSGRGRVVCTAAKLPFRRVIGVEFAEELCREARSFLSKIPQEEIAAGSVEIINEDAVAYYPPAGNCLLYLFNPFDESILGQFVDKLIIRQAHEKGSIRIVYYNPVHSQIFEKRSGISEMRLPFTARIMFHLAAPHSLRIFELRSSWGTNP